MLKLVYDSLVPQVQKRLLLTKLMDINIVQIFLHIYQSEKSKGASQKDLLRGLKKAEVVSSYPITKYFLTSRKIDLWKNYVKRASGESLIKIASKREIK